MNKQETIQDYYEQAREIAKIEKELSIERWVLITIDRSGDKEGEWIHLRHYDLPKHIAEKYDWVIRWRTAKLQCQFPRYQVNRFFSPYRRVMGENIGMQKDLDVFIAAKAKVTRQKRALAEYINYQRANNLFFDEDSDPMVIKIKSKLAAAEENVACNELRLIEKVKQYKEQHNK